MVFSSTARVRYTRSGRSVPRRANGQRLAAGTWHSFDITVTGRTYEVLLDGQPSTKFTADPTDPNERFRGRMRSEDPDSGFIGLQVHTGSVAFANVRIRPNVPLTA